MNRVERELDRILNRVANEGIELPHIVLSYDCSMRESPRNFAAVSPAHPTTLLFVCPDLDAQPVSRIRGILWHEIGHIIDWMTNKEWRHHYGAIEHQMNYDDEQWADAAVSTHFNVRILYDDELVQRAGPGAKGSWPRPKGLR